MLNKYSINPVFGLSVIPCIKLVKLSIKYQKKPNIILNTLRSIKEHLTNWQLPLLNLIPLSFLSYKLNIPLWYAFYPLSLIEFCSYKWYWVNTRKEINVIDNVKGICRIYSTNPLPEEKQLQLQLNTSITKILVDEKNKRMFHVKHSKNPNDYRKLDKGSLERLTQVLKDLNGNPTFESSQENDVEVTYSFIITLNIRILERQIKNIEHKTGLKKGTLTIDQDKGIVNFSIKKDISKIYILDEVITDKPKNMQLPFVLGVNYKSGSTVIEDLVNTKHLLIAGKTGSGKSCTFKGIIESLMYYNQNISWIMVDFAHSALIRYENFSNVKYIENDSPSVIDMMNKLLVEYEYRKKLFRDNKVENLQSYNKNNEPLQYIILAIDEANGFKSEWDKEEFEPLEKMMKTILQRGRKYGIFTIHAVQQTNNIDYVKSWKTQFTRISHLLEEIIDAQNITTNKELQQLISKLGLGEFYLLSDTDTRKMKGVLTDGEHDELYTILEKVYNRQLDTEKDIEIEGKDTDKNTAIN